VFTWLTDLVSDSAVTYLVAFAAAATDVLIPIVPSETIVITGGILAGKGQLELGFLIPVAAAGAILGDNICYWLGRRFGDRLAGRIFRGDKGRARIEWATKAVQRRGALLVLVGRFIPGGRTASTFAAGTLKMRWRRFFAADLAAGVLWALYSSLLGYVGGRTFEDSSWKPFVASIGAAVLIGLSIEVWRRLQRRGGKDFLGEPPAA
jgi:membrane-associated protein